MPSLRENPEVIEEYLQNKIQQGNILGPFLPHTVPAVHINRFAQKTSVRQMVPNHRLSFPESKSVNDSIYQNSVATYITVESSHAKGITLCKGSLIAKIDIKAAY